MSSSRHFSDSEGSTTPKAFFSRSKEDVKKRMQGIPLGSHEVRARQNLERAQNADPEKAIPMNFLLHGVGTAIFLVLWFLDRLLPDASDDAAGKIEADRANIEGPKYRPELPRPYLAEQLSSTPSSLALTETSPSPSSSSSLILPVKTFCAVYDLDKNKIAIVPAVSKLAEEKQEAWSEGVASLGGKLDTKFGAMISVLPKSKAPPPPPPQGGGGASSATREHDEVDPDHPHLPFSVTVTSWNSVLNQLPGAAENRAMASSVRSRFMQELQRAFGTDSTVSVA